MSFWQFMSAWNDTHEVINPKENSVSVETKTDCYQEVFEEKIPVEKKSFSLAEAIKIMEKGGKVEYIGDEDYKYYYMPHPEAPKSYRYIMGKQLYNRFTDNVPESRLKFIDDGGKNWCEVTDE